MSNLLTTVIYAVFNAAVLYLVYLLAATVAGGTILEVVKIILVLAWLISLSKLVKLI